MCIYKCVSVYIFREDLIFDQFGVSLISNNGNRSEEIMLKQRSTVEERFWRTQMMPMSYHYMLI